MQPMSESDLTATVLERLEQTPSPRLKEIMTSLVSHLHAFVNEVQLTEAEWLEGIQFLTQTGHMCDDRRQEFILLSDALGISMLVDLINHNKPAGATETTVMGPFYVEDSPELESGGNIAPQDEGPPLFLSGRVLDEAHQPIQNAALEVWQTASNGLYDVQDADQPELHMRGRFHTDHEGKFRLRSVRPISYPVPMDGPVGALFTETARHPYRPAHIHFKITADGFDPLTTHLFDVDDDYLESDAVFAIKPSLTIQFERHDSPDGAPEPQTPVPYYTSTYDFVLTRQ